MLDSQAFPVVINEVGLNSLLNSNTEATVHSATPLLNSYSLPSKFFGNNYINTWFPHSQREAAWKEYNRLCDGDFGTTSHSYTHMLLTNSGLKQATDTNAPLFYPDSQELICTIHIVHIGEIKEDARISDLVAELNSILGV